MNIPDGCTGRIDIDEDEFNELDEDDVQCLAHDGPCPVHPTVPESLRLLADFLEAHELLTEVDAIEPVTARIWGDQKPGAAAAFADGADPGDIEVTDTGLGRLFGVVPVRLYLGHRATLAAPAPPVRLTLAEILANAEAVAP